MLDHLSRLVDKSLRQRRARPAIQPENVGIVFSKRSARCRTGRAFCFLVKPELVRDRRLAFFLDIARRVDPELAQADQVQWLDRLRLLHDDLRSALSWCDGHTEIAVTRAWSSRHSCGGCGPRTAGSARGGGILRARARCRIRDRLQGFVPRRCSGSLHMTSFKGDMATTLVIIDEGLPLAHAAGDESAITLIERFRRR